MTKIAAFGPNRKPRDRELTEAAIALIAWLLGIRPSGGGWLNDGDCFPGFRVRHPSVAPETFIVHSFPAATLKGVFS